MHTSVQVLAELILELEVTEIARGTIRARPGSPEARITAPLGP